MRESTGNTRSFVAGLVRMVYMSITYSYSIYASCVPTCAQMIGSVRGFVVSEMVDLCVWEFLRLARQMIEMWPMFFSPSVDACRSLVGGEKVLN